MLGCPPGSAGHNFFTEGNEDKEENSQCSRLRPVSLLFLGLASRKLIGKVKPRLRERMKFSFQVSECCGVRLRPSLLQSFNRGFLGLAIIIASSAQGSEDAPRRPFAEWADVPQQGQLVWGTFYEQSESYHVWENTTRHNITVKTPDGESYGIDIRQGYFTLDYGLTERWAADVNFGATTVGWRSFNPDGSISKTTGLMDTAFGVRYQIFTEADATNSPWVPVLTFRAGAVLPGSYDRYIAFAPGNHSAAIEPSILFRKEIGWPGLGVWGDGWYRWMHTTGNDQYMASIGLFQKLGRWELDVGYRHLQAITGENIVLSGTEAPFDGIVYKSDTREISESIDAGFSYTTAKHKIRLGFHARKTFDGRNTDSKLWLGGFMDIPFNIFGHEK